MSAGRVGDEEAQYIGKVTVYRPRLGEVVTIKGGGGGGYGNPMERKPEKVLRDHLAGLISAERAREVYGVAFDGDSVDEAATRALRAAAPAPSGELFDFGKGRTQWVADYGPAADAIRDWLWSLPSGLRAYAREQGWKQLEASGTAPFTKADADAVIAELTDFLRGKKLI